MHTGTAPPGRSPDDRPGDCGEPIPLPDRQIVRIRPSREIILIIRLRTILGAIPRGLDALVDATFGSAGPAARRAAPLVVALLAAGLILGGLAFAHSAFSDYSAYLPWGVAILAAGALLWVLLAMRHRTDLRPSVVPSVIGLLLVVSAVPAVQAGAELIVTRTSTGDFVDRLTGTDVTLLEVQALAFRVPFPAPPEAGGDPAWFYSVRDDLSDPRVALVRSPIAPGAFDQREVVARVVVDSARVADAARALSTHGWLPPSGVDPDGGRYLAEATSSDGARQIGSAADLADAAPGTLVRIPLHFAGTGVAVCETAAAAGAAVGASCDARRLATGTGGFVQVATDASGRGLLVQTVYPASDAPIHVVGRQVRAESQLASLLTLPWVSRLLGWANVLPFAYLDHDPELPVNRLWLTPVLFLLLAFLLLIGRRVGYPTFILDDARSMDARAAATGDAVAEAGGAPGATDERVAAVVSGRLARPRGGPLDVEDLPGEVWAASGRGTEAGPRLVVRVPGETLEVALPSSAGAMTNLDRGSVHWIRGSRPALWLHWFGSDARLVFPDEATRARAERLLAPLREPAPRRPRTR